MVVAKGSNNILFGALPIKYVGDAAFNLTATASSGLTVTYTSSNPNVATVLGSLVTIVGEGTTTITANQAGDSNWNAAPSVTQTLTVQPAINRGLVAYYPFNGNANDESGNGRHATNSASNTQFLSGSELKVTMDNSYYYGSGGHVALPNFSGSISNLATVSLWVRDETLLEGDGEAYFSFGEVLSGKTYFAIERNRGGLIFMMWPQAQYYWTPPDWASYSSHKKHLVLVKTTNAIVAYVDGVRLGSLATSLSPFPIDNNRSAVARHWWGGGQSSARLTATFDNLRVYSRDLTDAEVAQLYSQEVGTIDSDGDGLTDAYERGYGRYQMVTGAFSWDQAKADAEVRGGRGGGQRCGERRPDGSLVGRERCNHRGHLALGDWRSLELHQLGQYPAGRGDRAELSALQGGLG
ncbi:hypothetical protein EBS57_07755 [bacterium]|nr:hypothetical protein [bacterium]